jgi:peptide subunit release factor 1 (eRF1)
MPLSSLLRDVNLTLKCKNCGHSIVKTGGWFMTVSKFKCDKCKVEQRLGYSDKVELFARHAHLTRLTMRGREARACPTEGQI